MPPLLRYEDLTFKRVGEAIDLVRQLFEGLLFLHRHYIAHRDYTSRHIAMLAECPWPQYYITLSLASHAYDPNEELLAFPYVGGDMSVPEYRQGLLGRHDPFAIDVYCLGNLIKRDFIQVYSNLDFMSDLVANMVHDDPGKRPPMDEVMEEFEKAVGGLTIKTMRKRLRRRRSRLINFFLKTCS
ncbi:hypothetical protein BD311DRAFT_775952 [Dichomitus squalens]|uniref:Protein kinase domain-containing protein n=1 Tax=Dichomitus squalens TaxID=114155 RepID=A0A4Q9MUL1_9APHY|nr:hypothetical protein BD311DRAFT_775952 [Dichomitus squalens]